MAIRIDPDISRLIVEAFDVDIQIFYTQALSNLKKTPAGCRISAWAEAHPRRFKNLLRVISVSIHRLPENSRFLPSVVSDHLKRLPFEVFRMIELDKKTPDISGIEDKDLLSQPLHSPEKPASINHIKKYMENGKNDFKKGMVTGLKWSSVIVLIILFLSVILIKVYG